MTKNKSGKILIVDDNEDVLYAAKLLLGRQVETVHTEKDPARLPLLLQNETYDVILLDMNYAGDVTSGQEGFYWLSRILEIDPGAVVILITAFGDVDLAVRAIKEGATDFVVKPWQNEKLLATLSTALNLRQSRSEVARLRSRQDQLSADLDQPYQEFIGISPAIRGVFDTIGKVAATDANVLVLGENGTGKELVARALHRQSARGNEVFISVDMGALSESLFESELFGHEKGAFTDAKSARAGRFEVASRGTLFLDEVSNIPLPLQSKILRVLETRQVIRLGSNRSLPVDIRLICATNAPLFEKVTKGEFRQDLLYRINTVEIRIPPLRDRLEDLPLLVDHFLALYTRKYRKPAKTLGLPAVKKLEKYPWPGNVRELRHAVERAVILSEAPVLQPGDFILSPVEAGGESLHFESLNLAELERLLIRKAIEKHRGNISHAARELGLTRAALYRRMEKHGL